MCGLVLVSIRCMLFCPRLPILRTLTCFIVDVSLFVFLPTARHCRIVAASQWRNDNRAGRIPSLGVLGL